MKAIYVDPSESVLVSVTVLRLVGVEGCKVTCIGWSRIVFGRSSSLHSCIPCIPSYRATGGCAAFVFGSCCFHCSTMSSSFCLVALDISTTHLGPLVRMLSTISIVIVVWDVPVFPSFVESLIFASST